LTAKLTVGLGGKAVEDTMTVENVLVAVGTVRVDVAAGF